MRKIRVTQTAKAAFAPDGMEWRFTLREESKKYADVMRKLDDRATTVSELLTSAGIRGEEVARSGARVGWETRDGKQVYTAVTEWRVPLRADDPRAADVSEALQNSGVQWVQSFTHNDTSYKDTLLAEAMRLARARAQTIAAAGGVKLGELTSVEYAAGLGGTPRLMRAAANFGEPEQIEESEEVTCEWEIV